MTNVMNIQIDTELHRKVKVAVAIRGTTIKDFTEAALRDKLDKTLVDSGVPYQTKEAK